jgi:hypothetical protein
MKKNSARKISIDSVLPTRSPWIPLSTGGWVIWMLDQGISVGTFFNAVEDLELFFWGIYKNTR